MKKSAFLSTFVVSAVLLTSACTPADRPVTDSNMRLKIQAQNARKNGGGGRPSGGAGQGKPYQVGSYQVSALLMDKQVEALELVRLAMQIDDGTKSSAKLKDKTETANGYSAKISLNSAPLAYNTDKGDFVTAVNKAFNVIATSEANQEGATLTLTSEGTSKQSLDKKGGAKTYVNLVEQTISVQAGPQGQDAGKMWVRYKSAGGLNGLANSSGFKENFEITLNLEIDKASLASDEIKVLKMAGELSFLKENGRAFKVTLEGENLKLVAEGLCNSLVGTSQIKSDKNGKKISYSESAVEIAGSNFKMSFAECGKRPTVDLSRLLPY